MKLLIHKNIGSGLLKELGFPKETKLLKDDVVDVTDDQGKKLLERGRAEVVTTERLKAVHSDAAHHEAEVSPVSQSNIADAIATIENMRSKDKLQHVIDNDPRATVKEAGKKRLASL